MTDRHPDWVKDLAFLQWELAANESARADGVITSAMYEYAREALRKEMASMEKSWEQGGGDDGGTRRHSASA